MPLMHGLSFDGSGKIVERDVPESDVQAFKASGYVLGAMPKVEKPEAEVKVEVAEKPKAKGKK